MSKPFLILQGLIGAALLWIGVWNSDWFFGIVGAIILFVARVIYINQD